MCKKGNSQNKGKENPHKFGCCASITEDLALEMTILSNIVYSIVEEYDNRIVKGLFMSHAFACTKYTVA